jgi:hypothetical protein
MARVPAVRDGPLLCETVAAGADWKVLARWFQFPSRSSAQLSCLCRNKGVFWPSKSSARQSFSRLKTSY